MSLLGGDGLVKLSDTMTKAVSLAARNGNKLTRHPGGIWSYDAFRQHGESYGTSTVNALVLRGVMKYSKWKKGRNGKFPVEATLTGL